jgi:neuronal cell adhesion protein
LITDNFYHLSELEIGSRYTIILVATTGTEDINLETESDPVILKTGGQALQSRNVAIEPWFIGLMVSLALLLIMLIIVCFLVRERGGKYSGKFLFSIVYFHFKKPRQVQMNSN